MRQFYKERSDYVKQVSLGYDIRDLTVVVRDFVVYGRRSCSFRIFVVSIHVERIGMKNKAIVIGGTSGLGLELASLLKVSHKQVFITGRKRPSDFRKASYFPLNLSSADYVSRINDLLVRLGAIDTVVYAAGFRQSGKLEELTRSSIEDMIQVGLSAPTAVLRSVLQFQKTLPTFIAITSTAQWTPHADQPVYCAVKAGLAMLTESVSLSGSVEKAMTVGVTGMNTPFWENTKRDTSSLLDPAVVAAKIIEQLQEDFAYRFIKVLRDPLRVEVAKERFS